MAENMSNENEKDVKDGAETAGTEETADIADTEADTAACAEECAEDSADEGDKLSEELEQVKDRLIRTMAEYDNFRKRSAREKDALRADIITSVTSQFLPVLDNLERALAADCSDENYKKGVQMIYDSFMQTLDKLGVKEIESDGAAFDPAKHQAVQRVESDELESGMIAQTFAKGYMVGDKVIRFAMVAVVN